MTGVESTMDKKALITKFELELRQAIKDFEEGKSIPLEKFDWGLPPFRIAESQAEYRVQNEAWTEIKLALNVSQQMTSIYTYIANNLANEPASYATRAIIENKISNISIFPNSGTFITSVIDGISEIFSSVQRRIAKRYVITYKYFEEIDTVLITHIFLQMQDYGKIFQK